MTPADSARFAAAYEHFERLCDLALDVQDAELRALAASDAALAARVEALLAADRAPSSPVDGVALAGLAHDFAPGAAPPERIGEFEIRGTLGEGGMGIVYEAEQHAPRRVVALKLVRAGLTTPERLRRFEHEASVLAWLNHPGIAQVYATGTAETAAGLQPWIAMELVRGARIDRYAADHALSVDARLALVAELCDAVQHAHQKGVVHRDLKPANVLVTDEGRVKVLDFGVARITDADLEALTRGTELGEVLGTLPYMSPEQVGGDPAQVDTRSDVYALGVLAYELLVGRRPHDLRRCSLAEAARVLVEEEPSTLGALDRGLRGDVETIVGKALEKDKERRYSSAEELASDLRRHLADEPILARRPGRAYLARKFARRHRGLVAGLALAFTALAAGAVVAMLLYLDSQTNLARATEAEGRWREAAGRAELEAAAAREVAGFLEGLFEVSDPSGAAGARLTGLQLLDRGREEIATRLDGQPELRAELMQVMGRVYFHLGQYETARPLVRDTIAALREQPAADPLELADALFALGEIAHYEGLLDEAGPLYEEALALREEHLAPDDLALATTLDVYGRLQRDLGGPERLARAQDLAERARALRAAADAGPMERSESAQSLAFLAQARGDLDEAEALLREAIALREQTPDGAFRLPELRHALGRIYAGRGEVAEAEAIFRAGLVEAREVFGSRHVFVAHYLSALANAVRKRGALEEAEGYLNEALDLVSDADRPLARQLELELAFLLHDRGDLDGAEGHYRALFEACAAERGADDAVTAVYRNNLATLLMDRGDLEEAVELLRVSIATYRREETSRDNLAISLHNLANCLLRLDRAEEALAPAEEAERTASAVFGEDSAQHAGTVRTLAAVRARLDD